MDTTPAIIQLVEKLGDQNLNSQEAIEQYLPEKHAIFDRAKRKKRKIVEPIPGKFITDSKGELIKINGEPVPMTTTRFEEVNRIAVAIQQLIVSRRVAFMNAGNLNVICKTSNAVEDKMLAMVKQCFDDNKVAFKLNEIAERKMSELQCAMLWYSEDTEPNYWGELAPGRNKRMRMKLLSPSLGDRLLPVFDANGRMVYFARGYKSTKDLTSLIDFSNPEALLSPEDFKNEEVEYLDIYSDTTLLKFERQRGVWVFKERVLYTYGSLPVIYFSQPKPEWANVQHIIERIETLLSNFGDTNDANGAPILFAKGIIKSMPAVGETAKIVNVIPQINHEGKEVGSSDLKYVSYDRAPDSIKLELETHLNNVYGLTDTPDISSKGMAELGLQSGVAFDRVFIGAHLGAIKQIQGNFGEGVQRMFNFLKKACAAINNEVSQALGLSISGDFPLFRINEEAEMVNMLVAATGGEPILSRKTAVELSGLTRDAEEENKRIEEQLDTLGKEIENDI